MSVLKRIRCFDTYALYNAFKVYAHLVTIAKEKDTVTCKELRFLYQDNSGPHGLARRLEQLGIAERFIGWGDSSIRFLDKEKLQGALEEIDHEIARRKTEPPLKSANWTPKTPIPDYQELKAAEELARQKCVANLDLISGILFKTSQPQQRAQHG